MSINGNYQHRDSYMIISDQEMHRQDRRYQRPQDNRSADVNAMLGYLYMADKRGNTDAKFSDTEIKDAIKTAADRGDKLISEGLGTFLYGGKDKKGLKPDTNNDSFVSAHEIFGLANQDGDSSTLSAADFKKAFPNRAKQGGNSFDPYANNTNHGNTGNHGRMQQMLGMLLQFLLQAFGGGSYGQGQNHTYSANRPY